MEGAADAGTAVGAATAAEANDDSNRAGSGRLAMAGCQSHRFELTGVAVAELDR